MPTINRRFLCQLMLAVAALAGSLFGLHAIQAARIPAALKTQADRSIEAEKPDKAIGYLRQYLEFRPDDVETQEQLANLLQTRAGITARADLMFLYDKILRADPTRTAIRRDAVTLSLRLGRYTDAQTHATRLLQDDDTDALVWRQLAQAQVGLSNSTVARDSFENSLKHDPAAVKTYQLYLQFLEREKQPTDARTLVDRMVKALPESVESYLARVNFELRTSQNAQLPQEATDPVLTDLDHVLKLEPGSARGLLLKAERLQRHRNAQGAYETLRLALKYNPDNSQIVRSLAWLEIHRGNRAAAIAILEESLATVKDPSELIVPLADLLLQFGEEAKTLELIAKLESRATPVAQLQANYLHARVAMRAKQWPEAIAKLKELNVSAVDLPMLATQTAFLLAACYQETHEPAREVESYRLVLIKEPGNLIARLGLAQSYLRQQQFSESLREFEAALQLPGAEVHVLATVAQMRALRLATTQTRTPEAWATLDRFVLENKPRFANQPADISLIRAELASLALQPQIGVKVLRNELSRSASDPRVWSKLSESTAEATGIATGLQVLDEAQGALGDCLELRLARAELYARDRSGLRPIVALEADLERWPADDQTRFRYGLVNQYDRVGDATNLIRVEWASAVERRIDAAAWLKLCERAARLNDQALSDKALAALRQYCPTDTDAILIANTHHAIAFNKQLDSQGIESKLREQFGTEPKRSDVCLLLGTLAERRGDTIVALAMYQRAMLHDSTHFEPMIALCGFYQHTSAFTDLARFWGQLALDPRWGGEPMRRVVRKTFDRTPPAQRPKLLEVARQLFEYQPNGLADLADLSTMPGCESVARSYLELALRQPNARADNATRLMLSILQQNDLQTATATLTQLKSALEPSTFVQVVAVCQTIEPTLKIQHLIDTPQLARQLCEAQLAIHYSRVDRAAGVSLLETFLTDTALSATDRGWANRQLAMLLTYRGGETDWQRAATIFQTVANDSDATPAELRSIAIVMTTLHRYLDGESRVALFAQLVKLREQIARTSNDPRDQFSLAQTYQSAGRVQDSIATLQRLLNQQPNELNYLLTAMNILVESKQFDQASEFAKRLSSVAPNDPRVVTAVARMECLAGHTDRATSLIEAYVSSVAAQSAEHPLRIAQAAGWYAELAQSPECRGTPAAHTLVQCAIQKYDAMPGNRPENLVKVAGLLASDGRIEEAFTRIEKATRGATVRVKAEAGIAMLRSPHSPANATRVADWVKDALQDDPNSLACKYLSAEFATLENDYATAERLYTAILIEEPRSIVALNNLAWILAPRPEAAEQANALIERARRETGLTGELLDTRARVRLASKQYELATRDSAEALKHQKTALRYFHMAMAMQAQPDNARDVFLEAKRRGLDPQQVHPADRATLQRLEADLPAKKPMPTKPPTP